MRHHRGLIQIRVKHSVPQHRDDPYREADERQFEVKDRVRESLRGIGDDEQDAGEGVDAKSNPHYAEKTLQRREGYLPGDPQNAQIDHRIRSDEQRQAKSMKEEHKIECKRRLRLAQPCTESAVFDGPQKCGWDQLISLPE